MKLSRSLRLSLTDYMQDIILQLKQAHKLTTASHYTSALHSFRRFLESRNETDILIGDISADTMSAYESFLHAMGVGRNTSSAYIRSLRATYNRAVDQGLVSQNYPFRRVYTGVEKTVKRSVSLKTIGKIKSLDLKDDKTLDFARDMFMLSFYLRGMSFVDMAFLRKSDLRYGYISYRRRKTGQRLTIRWTTDMQEIINKYKDNNSQYLLPIIRRNGLNEHYAYRNALGKVNKSLKEIGRMVGIPDRLTHYVARHSWASGAHTTGIPLKVISEGMGHDSETTTRIYLSSLDNSEIDKANDIIIKAIR